MIDPDVPACRVHRGEPAGNCGPCRSERIADPAAEPDRIHTDALEALPVPRRGRRPRRLRIPAPAHLRLVPDRDDQAETSPTPTGDTR